ncbi:membrane protein [Stenotrophomonas ginsengisoli]|uniref:Protein HflK n=1 Tax=Stenotrophomonas ginsengisoli TaxID=336566 RepID=A0A0R0DAQ2_9GAMM|nr:FtsH protease activity modulator HflK [Stenotrophomonas ginsengisoli]KRG74942.1 membrane protein [Stenotrophomonas ginsengisoli]
MAWNVPGSGGGKRPDDNPRGDGNWPPRGNNRGSGGGNGGGFGGGLPGPLRDLFDGGIGRWVLLAVGLGVVLSSFQLIGEQQRGVVLRFGQFSRVLEPGPNFKLPWPIESVVKVNATQIKTFSATVPVLTRDENIVSVTMNVQYRVEDPRAYLFGTIDADQVLEQVAQSAVREQVGRADLNSVLNNRGPLAITAGDRLQEQLASFRTGLSVTGLTLPDARPPEEVKPAFDEVNGAQQVKERLINEAQAYAAKVVPEARGQATRTRTVAEGYKESVIAKADGDAQRFSLLAAEYRNAPEVTRKRLWLETVQQVLAGNRKVIGGDGRQLIYVPMPADAGRTPASPVVTPEVLAPAMTQSPADGMREAGRSAVRGGREEVVR